MRHGIVLVLLAAARLAGQAPAAAPGERLAAAIATEKAGKTGLAIQQFDAILKTNPPLEIAGQAHLELARIYQSRGDWWEATSQWEALRKLAPSEPEYAYQLGLAYQHLSKWAFERMYAKAPNSARAQMKLGEELAAMGRQEKAIEAFENAIAADPKLQGPHLALAVIHLQAGKKDEALAEIDRELEIAPESVAAKQLRQAVAGSTP